MGTQAQEPTTATAALTWSQQDYEEHWEREELPVNGEGYIECRNPSCSSAGFERTRLSTVVTQMLDSGTVVAGAIRCEGIDKANVTPCTNALVYLIEED